MSLCGLWEKGLENTDRWMWRGSIEKKGLVDPSPEMHTFPGCCWPGKSSSSTTILSITLLFRNRRDRQTWFLHTKPNTSAFISNSHLYSRIYSIDSRLHLRPSYKLFTVPHVQFVKAIRVSFRTRLHEMPPLAKRNENLSSSVELGAKTCSGFVRSWPALVGNLPF